MAAPMKRVVGWFGKEEWESVYYDIYSDDSTRQRRAVDRIAVWKSRMLHRLSSGVECTWQLVAAVLLDQDLQESGNPRSSEQQMRMSYAMALVRFVNHLTDKNQPNKFMAPVHVMAEELGLPIWLVEMRHDATHASLPSLALLRSATQYALTWIKREYWDAEALDETSGDEAVTLSDKPVLTQLTDLLVGYKKIQIQNISEKEERNLHEILNDLRKTLKLCRDQSIPLLLSDGYFIPTVEQLHNIGIKQEMLSSDDLDLPDSLQLLWWPLLGLLQEVGLLPLLLHSLAVQQGEDNTPACRIAAGWLVAIVTAIFSDDIRLKREKNLDGHGLLQTCLLTNNQHTHSLIKCLLKHLDVGLSNDRIRALLGLVDRYGNQDDVTKAITDKDDTDSEHIAMETSDTGDNGTDQVYTVETLLAQCGTPCKTVDETPSKCWKISTEPVDWSAYPIGTCPYTELTSTSLELDLHLHNVGHRSSKQSRSRSQRSRSLGGSDEESDDEHSHQFDELDSASQKQDDGPVTAEQMKSLVTVL